MKLVSTILKACAEEMQIDEEAFVKRFQEEQEDRVDEEAAKNQERLRTAKRRKDELMTLLNRIYEDHILGKLPDERYEAMDAQYSAELEKVSTDLASCEKLARVNVSHEKSAKHFVEVLKRYQDFDNLTTAMMNEFVEKIVVYEREIKGSQTSPQRIDVYFNFIGQYIPDSLKNRTVSKEEIEEAIRKVEMGPAKKSKVVSEKEKRLTAYHEAGHAVVARSLPEHLPIHEVTIIPRGRAGGYTMYLPQDDVLFETKQAMYRHIITCMGGRAAESLKLDDISIGASGDIKQATDVAREMITKYGFSEKLGNVNYGGDGEVFLGNDFTQHKNYSEETAKEIDEEIRRFVGEAYERALSILREKDDVLEKVAQALLLVETIDGDQFEALYTGKITPEDLKADVDKAGEEKKAKNAEEAAERERLRAEEQERLLEELRKYDEDYLDDDEVSEATEKEKEGEDESNS